MVQSKVHIRDDICPEVGSKLSDSLFYQFKNVSGTFELNKARGLKENVWPFGFHNNITIQSATWLSEHGILVGYFE